MTDGIALHKRFERVGEGCGEEVVFAECLEDVEDDAPDEFERKPLDIGSAEVAILEESFDFFDGVALRLGGDGNERVEVVIAEAVLEDVRQRVAPGNDEPRLIVLERHPERNVQ